MAGCAGRQRVGRRKGVAIFADQSPDLTLLDVNMPRLNGWDMLRRMREISDAPVILLTARGDELDKVKGLELGADDYLTKPFSHLELFARIKAVLRRVDTHRPGQRAPVVHQRRPGNQLRQPRSDRWPGSESPLTPTEYNLLYLLVRNAGRVLPFETLLARVWGDEYRSETDYLKTYISRLRHKLGDDSEHPRYILTERGTGYRFARATTPSAAA